MLPFRPGLALGQLICGFYVFQRKIFKGSNVDISYAGHNQTKNSIYLLLLGCAILWQWQHQYEESQWWKLSEVKREMCS